MAIASPVVAHTDEADMLSAEGIIPDWLQLIRAEYREVPGLHLTEAQARRLWGLDPMTCQAILSTLVEVGFLKRSRQGAYLRADRG